MNLLNLNTLKKINLNERKVMAKKTVSDEMGIGVDSEKMQKLMEESVMSWRDSRVEIEVADEMKITSHILTLIAHLEPPVAERILNYCDHYIKSKEASTPNNALKQAIEKGWLKNTIL